MNTNFIYPVLFILVLALTYQFQLRDIQGVALLTNRGGTYIENEETKRFGMVVGVKPDKVDEYRKVHRNVWPGVLEQLEKSNITNYSIYLQKIDDEYYLFSYYEYVGNNYERDMNQMAANSTVQAWWEITESYQVPLDSHADGEWWTQMEEVFHFE